MSEQQVAEAATKSKTVYTPVVMTDGRTVQFAGKRRLNKEYLIDESKFEIDEAAGIIQLSKGAIKVRMDFLNGKTLTTDIPLSLLPKFAGHGGVQKAGDNLAAKANEPMSDDDMVLATEDLFAEFAKGNWGKAAGEGGGAVAGASLVLRAIMEVNNVGRPDNGKPVLDIAAVKAYVDGILKKEESKPEADRLTRRDLYKAFRAGDTPLAKRIAELEKEVEAKSTKPAAAAAVAEVSNI